MAVPCGFLLEWSQDRPLLHRWPWLPLCWPRGILWEPHKLPTLNSFNSLSAPSKVAELGTQNMMAFLCWEFYLGNCTAVVFNLRVHRNHLKDLLKHSLLSHSPTFWLIRSGMVPRICSSGFQVVDDDTCPKTTHWKLLTQRLGELKTLEGYWGAL